MGNWNPLYLFPFRYVAPLSTQRLLIGRESIILESLTIFLQFFEFLFVWRRFDQNDLIFDELLDIIGLEWTDVALMLLHLVDPLHSVKGVSPQASSLVTTLVASLVFPSVVVIVVIVVISPSVIISPSTVVVIVAVSPPTIVIIVVSPTSVIEVLSVTEVLVLEELSAPSSEPFGPLLNLCEWIKAPHILLLI